MDTTILKRTVPERVSVPSTVALKVGIIEVTGIYLVMHMLTFGILSIDSVRERLSPIIVLMPLAFFLLCLALCWKPAASRPKERNRPENETSVDPGLMRYIRSSLGEYLTDSEMHKMCRMLCRIRERASDIAVAEIAISIRSDEHLSSRDAERKILRKYNLYAFVHNMCGYLHVTRKEAAIILKEAFPGIFKDAKIVSIDKSLTVEKNMRKLEIPYLESNTEASFMEHIESLNNQIQ